MADTDAAVVFETWEGGNGRRIGVATLDSPATLNGVSLPMARALGERLVAWEDDPAIALVILRGNGPKAFCAGGDLQALYRAILDFHASGSTDVRDNAYARAFFEAEYRLDYHIHTYAKPLLCWGHGYVMGGGIGLMAGASHRVVTETSRLAMPEVGIGLYPDVAGSWLLDRVPGRTGRFLALTAAQLDAGDAIFAGLADHAIAGARQEEVFAALRALDWQGARAHDERLLDAALRGFALALEHGPLRRHFDALSDACRHATVEEAVAAIAALPDADPWIARAQKTMAAGAPGSLRLSWEMQRRAHLLSLADTFRMEYLVSLHCAASGDFGEGIRALLIDKDRTPHWRPATLAGADARWLQGFFDAPWPAGAHPLADLG